MSAELCRQAAEELGLKEGTPVAQGGGDAWIGQVGLNVVQPGKMALITGSSHVLIGQSDHEASGQGFFGAYTDAVIPGQYTVEGGQVSTGSVLKWFKEYFCKDVAPEAQQRGLSVYDVLNERSEDSTEPALPELMPSRLPVSVNTASRTPMTTSWSVIGWQVLLPEDSRRQEIKSLSSPRLRVSVARTSSLMSRYGVGSLIGFIGKVSVMLNSLPCVVVRA